VTTPGSRRDRTTSSGVSILPAVCRPLQPPLPDLSASPDSSPLLIRGSIGRQPIGDRLALCIQQHLSELSKCCQQCRPAYRDGILAESEGRDQWMEQSNSSTAKSEGIASSAIVIPLLSSDSTEQSRAKRTQQSQVPHRAG
jgi:hypothetical protein